MADQFQIDDKEFVAFYKAVAQVDPELKKALRKKITALAKPIVADVKQAAIAIPSQGGDVGGTRKKKGETLGLRAGLANATKSDFNGTGRGAVVHIRVSSSKFIAATGRPRSLPYYMEGRRKRKWRHPVFGNKENWVEQSPHPFLAVTVFKHKDSFVDGVADAVNEVLGQIDHKVD
ncbi:MAG: hypothetical protein WCG15_01180 [Actinomycetes bacterium]